MKVAILIDGGNLRVLARLAKRRYTADLIESTAHSCIREDEQIFRILYYDCAPFNGEVSLPVSGKKHQFERSRELLDQVAKRDLFATREGILKFRGFKPKNIPISTVALTDDHFEPDFEQKGVDMRIGLDIATFCTSRAVERIILISSDTDCIPAMKHGRKSGLQIVLMKFPKANLARELAVHSDYLRQATWPAENGTAAAGPNAAVKQTA